MAKTNRETSSGTAGITHKFVKTMASDFAANPMHEILQNAVTQVSVQTIATRREIVAEADPTFSIHLDDWPVTNQEQSGRCWMFAGLNVLRADVIKKLKVAQFEFSQNYLLFWDKLEKANYFLEAMLKTVERDVDDRTVAHLLRDPVGDGGQWNMFVSLIRKYGLIPKSAMPETESSSHTKAMNGVLVAKLREGARTFRDAHAAGSSLKALRAIKGDLLNTIYRILCIHLGNPPDSFDWQWKDKKKAFHRVRNMTPHTFAQRYVALPLAEYVCLVHDPRNPYDCTYTIEYLGNVIGGGQVTYLNVEMERIKQIAVQSLQGGEPVWFGCDVGKQMDEKTGVWDETLRDYEKIYGTTFSLDKAERLVYGATQMTHAMVFTGVDLVGRTPRRWRVENSWGEKGGQKGFFLMNDSWFDEHVFEIAARKSKLPQRLQKTLELKPRVLPAWDPMGSLARDG